jgi:hypothetical protein
MGIFPCALATTQSRLTFAPNTALHRHRRYALINDSPSSVRLACRCAGGQRYGLRPAAPQRGEAAPQRGDEQLAESLAGADVPN